MVIKRVRPAKDCRESVRRIISAKIQESVESKMGDECRPEVRIVGGRKKSKRREIRDQSHILLILWYWS